MKTIRHKIGSSGRKEYDKNDVKRLKENRKNIKAKKEGVTDSILQMAIGDLRAAGHLKILGTVSEATDADSLNVGHNLIYKKTTIEIVTVTEVGYGDSPHLIGYLESASDADKSKYKLKGWINPDATIRLEIVK